MKSKIKNIVKLLAIFPFILSCSLTQIDLKEDVLAVISFLDYINIDKEKFLQNAKSLTALEIKEKGDSNISYEKLVFKKAKLEIFAPKNKSNKSVIYIVHGGAYVYPLSNIYRNLAKFFINNNDNYDVALLDYDILDSARYPIANDQTYDGLEYLMNRYEKVNALGDSAGANLVMSTLIKRNENKEKLVNSIVLYSPFLDISFTVDSRTKNKNKDILIGSVHNKDYEFINLLKDNDYYKNVENKKDYYISPIYYNNFNNFPPTYIEVGMDEVLFDDSKILAKKLPRVKLVGIKGLFHDFQILTFISTARESVIRTIEFLDKFN
ncbi:alpha/beta hydrolase [Oceanivirga miroungae]|uniref:Alpha/beta hydrolase n=1 Tax=Oceanivirga miroungae TaxID=1130046 RepID=A0A6I8MDE9_9FUSO|nr:alpha/beta hydrolase [Oceanivirga miroungae]VWL85481.1 alpha/beta hydrolase [Oceanivirga miroungae]